MSNRQRVEAVATTLSSIQPLREVYREKMDCQIIHDSIHSRPGWSREYLLRIDSDSIGYGSVACGGPWLELPTIYEFFVASRYRDRTFSAMESLMSISEASTIETQSNDPWLAPMLMTYCREITCEAILFRDHSTTSILPGKVTMRARSPDDQKALDQVGLDVEAQWIAMEGDEIVGVGRILHHYNHPYQDLYMKVREEFRGRGIGSFIVQELKRVCYESGCVPSARCNFNNVASRMTLQRAGFIPCGNLIKGHLAM